MADLAAIVTPFIQSRCIVTLNRWFAGFIGIGHAPLETSVVLNHPRRLRRLHQDNEWVRSHSEALSVETEYLPENGQGLRSAGILINHST